MAFILTTLSTDAPLHAAAHAESPGARQAFYDAIGQHSMTPLWEVLHALVPPSPTTPCLPALWKYSDIRPFLMVSGQLITAEEAVRRVLVLENPALRGQSCITQSLYAGLQVIMPGEVAPSHRHTQSALRFVVEGQGAYTAVDGERTTMQPGDFIITPSWTWHDHGHDGPSHQHGLDGGAVFDQPVVWLDGLDIPMLRFFDAGFAENGSAASQPITKAEGISTHRYSANMLPVRYDAPFGQASPIFSYPFERTRQALHELESHADIDAWDGVKLRYINPATGGSPIPTMAAFMQRLPAGFSGKPHRQTDGAVFSVVEGQARVVINSIQSGGAATTFDVNPRDHFVIPSWHTARFASQTGCVLFSFSDRPVHQALGIHKEERM